MLTINRVTHLPKSCWIFKHLYMYMYFTETFISLQ